MTLEETTTMASSTPPTARTMFRLGRSVLQLSWAGALLGTGQLLRLARLPGSSTSGDSAGDSAGEPAAAFEALALAARRRMDPLPKAIYQAADDFQNEWLVNVPRDLSASSWRRFSARLTAEVAASLTVMRLDAEGTLVRQEIFHKLEVYLLVRRASVALGPMAETRQRFEAAVDRALKLEPRHALWVLEGLAHGHAQAVLARDPNPLGLLVGVRLPQRGQVMAHLGLGMALAEHVFGELHPRNEESAGPAVERFVELCRSNSVPEHEDAALEALGLVLRCFLPEWVYPVDRALGDRSREVGDSVDEPPLRDYFWHGVGRAIYFLPLHLLPGHGTIEAALRRLDQEVLASLDPVLASRNGRAGVAYAATMVNLGQPEVLERFLRLFPQEMDSAFVEGITSSVLLRHRTTPEDPDLATFLEYRPAASEVELAQRWRQLVNEPLEAALVHGRSEGGAVLRNLSARALPSEPRGTQYRGLDFGSPDSGSPDSGNLDSENTDSENTVFYVPEAQVAPPMDSLLVAEPDAAPGTDPGAGPGSERAL
ncbi:MAG: hypothetical protein K0U98_25470 [Deltaproteobacteria bacterium]|nr:hypothetical protein [Deltaproteobacteria bacterium]